YGVGGRRLRGYRRAFAERSLRMRDDWLIPTPVTLHGGDEAFSTAWAQGARPTAVLAVSDIIAMGTLRAARRLGVRVPEDLEVIGFDDVPLAVASQPALSTVHQPIPEKGRVAIRLLIRELDEGGPRERIVLPTELVLRESTRTFAMPARDEVAAAASPTPSPTIKPVLSKEGTLTIWVDGARTKMVTDLGKKFTDKYKVAVQVQELGFGDIRDQLKIAGPAKEGPDIIIGAHDWLGELVSNGLLLNLDLGAKASSVDPVAIKAFTYDAKLYGLPYLVEAVSLIYNKDFVPNPPKTWDELKTIAKQLQDDKKVEQGYVMQQGDPYHTEPLLTGFGGYIFGRDTAGNYNPKDLGLDS